MTETKQNPSAQKYKNLPARLRNPDLMIWLLLGILLVVGLLVLTHYGESWDEPEYINYATASLGAYQGGSTQWVEEKGPFFGMAAFIGAKGLQLLIPGWKFIDGWHFMTFLAFLMGVYFFFRLSRRIIDPVPALVATVLFSTQPIIWGHAFFNHQDIPFMAFFLASVTLGLEMIDHHFPQGFLTVDSTTIFQWMAEKWKTASKRKRRVLIIAVIVWLGYWLLYPLIQLGVGWLINQAYYAPGNSWLGQLFSHYAQQAGEFPVGAYISKAQTVISRYVVWPWMGLSLVFALIVSWFIGWMDRTKITLQRSLLEWRSAPWRKRSLLISSLVLILTAGILFNATPLAKYIWLAWIIVIGLIFFSINVARNIFPFSIGPNLSFMFEPRLLVAACFLGFSSDIRTLGIASGLLIGVYAILKIGRKAIPLLAAYFALGAVVIYIFWPYLWNSPLTHFLGSLSMAANFPAVGMVTFAGQRIQNNELPFIYLPTLFGLQFTETALIVILVGAVLSGIYIWKKTHLRLDLLLLGGWFLGPVGAAILLHSTLYNNFRQFLFVLPPLFILAGLAIQKGWIYLKAHRATAVFALLGLTLIVPGIYWDIQLHPFEYVYYNGLVGNVQGAYRSYPLDYWSTSFMMDIEYVNDTAPQNSIVFVDEPASVVLPYVRPDLKIIERPLPFFSINENYYAISVTENYRDRSLLPFSQVIFQITRDKAILSVVKIVRPWDQVWR